MPRYVTVAPAEALAPGQRKLVFTEGRSIVAFNIDGNLHAIDNSCPHSGAALAGGKLEGTLLQCPAHGLRFDVTTGCMPGKGGLCVATFPVCRAGGDVVLEL